MHLGLRAILSCHELDAAVVVNGGVEPRAFAVDGDLCKRSHRAGETAPLAVHRDHESHAGTPVVFAQADACGEQRVGDVQLTEIEQAVLDIVDPHGKEVQCVDRGDLEDAERRYRIRRVQLWRQILDAVDDVRLADGNTSRGDAERIRDQLRHHRGE